MSPLPSEADLRGVLNGVIHPSFGLSLVALGMVQAVRVQPGAITVDLALDCPGCPAGEAILTTARQRLARLAGAVPVQLRLVPNAWHPPWE